MICNVLPPHCHKESTDIQVKGNNLKKFLNFEYKELQERISNSKNITSKADLKLFLNLDSIALGFNKPTTFFSKIKNFLFPNVIWEFQKTMRYLEYYTNCRTIYNSLFWFYYKIIYRKLSLKLGFTIPINVFGPGLSIAHYGTIIINPNAKIGSFCRIHAGVNIGASAGKSEAPQIGDNVYIGPGAILFGDIEIANNTTIGANATVNKSCLENYVILAGTPARIVKTNYQAWFYNQ